MSYHLNIDFDHLETIIGIYDNERLKPQLIKIKVRYENFVPRGGAFLDYAMVEYIIRQLVVHAKFELLEDATKCLWKLCNNFVVDGVIRIEICKINALQNKAKASISYTHKSEPFVHENLFENDKVKINFQADTLTIEHADEQPLFFKTNEFGTP